MKNSEIHSNETMSAKEIEALIALGKGPQVDYDAALTWVDLFITRAKDDPGKVAVADRDTYLTYAELDRRSDILAHVLIERGVQADDFVAVMLERTVRFPLVVLAIHKAGAAYVPIDLEYPAERVEYMLSDSAAKLVIDDKFISGVDFAIGDARPVNRATPDTLAYMIYTSGSTGLPKGAMVQHSSLRTLACTVSLQAALSSSDRLCAHPSFSFSAHIMDFYSSLSVGAEWHIVPEDIRKDLPALRDFIASHKITGGTFSTALGSLLLEEKNLATLRYVLLGGEKLKGVSHPEVTVINGYGCTECTCCTTYYTIEPGEKPADIPIGRPVPNAYAFIIDEYNCLVPQGDTGELCIAGPIVGKGYWNRDELTAERFIDCPFMEGRMYKTGDLARWNENGQLEFVGRMDTQVSLRGFRIELGEVESKAIAVGGIRQAVAEVKTVSGADNLVLYYVPDGKPGISGDDLRKALESSSLAEYMVPSICVPMETLPLTPNGKVDRRALPEPAIAEVEYVAPEGETENSLTAMVSDLLGIGSVSSTANLISLGMSSIVMMRLAMRINNDLGTQIKVKDIMSAPTVKGIAGILDSGKAGGEAALEVDYSPRDFYPLTENQRGVYVDWEMNRDTTQYNLPVVTRLGSGIDAERLVRALENVINAHPYIKTRLVQIDGDVMQVRRDDAAATVSFNELDCEPDEAFFQSLTRPFDLFDENLYRIGVYRSPEALWLYADIHHIVYDGASSGLFMRDLARAYAGEEIQAERFTSFEYSLTEQALMQTGAYQEAEKHFDAVIGGMDATMYPTSSRLDNTERHTDIATAKVASDVIAAFCRRNGITPANHFLAALLQVLRRVTREDGVLITTIHNGRDDARMQESYGMLVKTLPVSLTGIDCKATFTECALAIQRQVAESADRSIYPFTHIVSRHGIHPNILYAYQGMQEYVSAGDSELLAGAESIPLELDTAKLPLSLDVKPSAEGFELVAEYDTAMYCRADVDTLLSMIGQTALNAAAAEGAQAKDIPLISDADREKIVRLGEGEKYAYDTEKTWVDLFVGAAAEHSGSVAVADRDRRLTYAELDSMSDAMARILINKGVKPNDFVAIMLDRTVRFPLAALAVHKAGAAYVPIDKEYPQERIDYMLSDSGASMVIDEEFMDTLDLAGQKDVQPVNQTTLENRAYMIYTSGSTGQPKGVVIPHKALASFVQFIARKWRLTSSSHISCHSSFSFDASMEDLYPVLTVGGQMHIVPEECRKDFDALYRFICERGITGGCYTTLFGQMLLQDYRLPVDYLVVGGEKMTAVPDCGIRLINTYGPTEFTVDATFYEIEPGRTYDNIPIGRPLDNQTAFIVDNTMNLVPQGVAGELCLYGPQMSLGYWNKPEKTREVFVPCQFVGKEGAKMYRTGDLVKWNEEGQIEYLGRIDNQVKLRGFRIELGEIESQAMDIEGIGQAVADVKKLNDSDYLVLYYTLAEGATLTEAEIKSALDSSSLAEYMRPDFYVLLDAIPLTPNDKVNHKALPDPDLAGARKEGAAPANELEATLCGIFAETLKLETVYADDDFFKIGGTSLIGIRVLLKAKQNGIEILYKDLFDNPTPQRLAAFLSANAVSDADDAAQSSDAGKDKDNGMIDLEDYNYYRINKLLRKNTLESFVSGGLLPLKDVVLFGANGYLGIHILEQLLDEYTGRVYCVIRAKDDDEAMLRLSRLYFYYHSKLLQDYAERICVVAGSITDKPSFGRLDEKLDETGISRDASVTVINCAANVKHFSAGTDIEDVNYYGCLNVLEFCKVHGYRFVQTSTMSVSGLVDMKNRVVVPDYTEQELFFGQDYTASKYIYSKLLSERATLEAGADGLTVKIMRLGNLSPRSSDGEFQISPRTNSFMRQFKGYAVAGAYPWDVCLADDHCAPIDDTARTVLLLAQTPKECVVFHNFNNHNILIGDVIKAMCRCGIELKGMEMEEFTDYVRTLDEETVDLVMTNVVAYKTGASSMVTPNIRNSYTHQVLLRMGFTWSDTGDLYMEKFVKGLKDLDFFSRG